MIVVTGATGTIGSELVRRLSVAGEPVRGLSRAPGRGEARAGMERVRADLARMEELPQAFEGGDRLFLLTGNSEDMVWLQKNAIQAAREAGIRRVVKLSALGATDHSKSVIALWHYNVERMLRDSEMAWTFLRPHHFMQNLLDPAVHDRESGRVHSPSGEGRIPFIDTRDVAACAAAVLTEAGHEGRTYTLTGPEPLSYEEATEIVSEVTGRELTYVPETMDEAWKRLREAGRPPWLAASLLAIAGYQRGGGATERVTDTVERLTDRQARTLRQFAEDHADRLRP